MCKLIMAGLAACFISCASADTAKMLASTVIELDSAALTAAPWLNQSHFLVIRSAEDPACKWIEKITGKPFAATLKKRPLLVYSGFSDATYFVSGEGKNQVFLLNADSLKQRDPFSSGLSIAVAELPANAPKIFWIEKRAEDVTRLGVSSGGGMGAGQAPGK